MACTILGLVGGDGGNVLNISKLVVCGFYVIVKLVKFFNDLFTCHERFRKSAKSTVSLCEICWRKERYGCDEVGGVVKISSRGVRGVGSVGCEASSWSAIGEVMDKVSVVVSGVAMWLFEGDVSFEEMSMMLVRATFLGGFLVEDEALEVILKEDSLPFPEIELHFTKLHLKRIMNKHLTLFGEAFGRGSFIEDGVTDKDWMIQRSVIDRIWVDALWERCNRPINREHISTFAWNTKNFGKTVERKNDFKVSNNEGNRDYLVDVTSDLNTLVEFEDKQWKIFFVDIQKAIKVDGRKDLGNVGVI
ncbi:hypothetical protein Tco_1503980 [Tanacetum coccineum]